MWWALQAVRSVWALTCDLHFHILALFFHFYYAMHVHVGVRSEWNAEREQEIESLNFVTFVDIGTGAQKVETSAASRNAILLIVESVKLTERLCKAFECCFNFISNFLSLLWCHAKASTTQDQSSWNFFPRHRFLKSSLAGFLRNSKIECKIKSTSSSAMNFSAHLPQTVP